MNEMLKRIIDVFGKDVPYCVRYDFIPANWKILKNMEIIESFMELDDAEDCCEQMNKEWLAREIVQCMREPTDEQRNNYYELAFKTEVMHDAHWERAIDAILKVSNDR